MSAAQSSDELQTSFAERAQVLEVQLQIHVTDRRGHPISDLTPRQFRVFDDGEEQTISAFEVLDLERETAMPSSAVAARRRLLLLFDLENSSPQNMLRTRRMVRDAILEHLHPSDLVAVATYREEGGLRWLLSFTPDRAQVVRAIDTLGAPALLHDNVEDPLGLVLEPTNSTSSDSGLEALESQQLTDFLTTDQEHNGHGRTSSALRWIDSMAQLAKALAHLEARKQIFLLSEGWDGELLFGPEVSLDESLPQAERLAGEPGDVPSLSSSSRLGSQRVRSAVESMLEELRRANCVLQTIDVAGLTPRTGSLVASGSHDAHGRRRDALFYLANEAGGLFLDGSNDLSRQLGRALESSRVTYLVTFSPQRQRGPGEYHRLRVRLDLEQPHRLSHRVGYFEPSHFEELDTLTRSLLNSDLIAAPQPRADLPLEMLAAPFRAHHGRAYTPVILEFDGEALRRAHADRDQIPLELYLYASDAQGRMVDWKSQQLTVLVAESALAERSGLKYYGHLELPPGRHQLRILARSLTTGAATSKTAVVLVPPLNDPGPQLLPPFFLDDPSRWVLVREPPPEGKSTVIYPFTLNGEPFVPAATAVLLPRQPALLALVAYNLGPGRLSLESRLWQDEETLADGPSLRLDERTVTGIPGVDKLLVSFEVTGAKPGRYHLQITVSGDGGSASSTVELIIR